MLITINNYTCKRKQRPRSAPQSNKITYFFHSKSWSMLFLTIFNYRCFSLSFLKSWRMNQSLFLRVMPFNKQIEKNSLKRDIIGGHAYATTIFILKTETIKKRF